jgi:REP element-mobilizing transposase RayT
LGNIVAYFKYQTTKQINARRNCPGQKIWQRGYYDHIIRDDIELNRTLEYIQNNPWMWDEDDNNPEKENNRWPIA